MNVIRLNKINKYIAQLIRLFRLYTLTVTQCYSMVYSWSWPRCHLRQCIL